MLRNGTRVCLDRLSQYPVGMDYKGRNDVTICLSIGLSVFLRVAEKLFMKGLIMLT